MSVTSETIFKHRWIGAKVDALKRLQDETSADEGASLPALLHHAFRGKL